ncbi:MAG: PEGA domain-containing protein [Phycisphaerales bacterium]|nr:MAG: PEGA domain-containing protein [Phycisphaerales bacterium]
MTITTQPAGALVYLNDEEVGRSEVTVDFTWYGDYEVLIRKDGYATLNTHWTLRPPWYQIPPLDFVAEVLWPGQIVDARQREFTLQPQPPVANDALFERAMETRRTALDADGNAERPDVEP